MRRHRNLLVAAPVAVAAVVAFAACTPAEADGHQDGGPEDRSSSTAPDPEPAEADAATDAETDVAAPHDDGKAGATTPSEGHHHANDRVSTDARSGTQDGCQAHQLDVNVASPDDLERIVHIGSARAEQLEKLRPFSGVRDLTRIPGIGERRLLDIVEQDLACAG